MQEKEIVVINLTSKTINPKPGGKTFTPFTVYEIHGNDGVKYETTSKDFFQGAIIGRPLKIKFQVESKTYNNRVYTTYKIDTPKRGGGMSTQEIIERLDQIERKILNAIAGIKVLTEKPENPNQPSLFEESDYEDIDESELEY